MVSFIVVVGGTMKQLSGRFFFNKIFPPRSDPSPVAPVGSSQTPPQPTPPFLYSVKGFCPICENETNFVAKEKWLRGSFICVKCEKGSVPRERALAMILRETVPGWKDLRIHESSPMERGISIVLKRDCKNYVGSHFFPDQPFGSMVGQWRNENIEQMTFEDNSFDITISLDVMEHVFDPKQAFKEIYRTLKPGGYYICTFPIRKYLTAPLTVLAALVDDQVIHAPGVTPEYHGNPIAKEALVTVDYGYDIHQLIGEWADFDIRITRFNDKNHGIQGEYTEVIVCKKPH